MQTNKNTKINSKINKNAKNVKIVLLNRLWGHCTYESRNKHTVSHQYPLLPPQASNYQASIPQGLLSVPPSLPWSSNGGHVFLSSRLHVPVKLVSSGRAFPSSLFIYAFIDEFMDSYFIQCCNLIVTHSFVAFGEWVWVQASFWVPVTRLHHSLNISLLSGNKMFQVYLLCLLPQPWNWPFPKQPWFCLVKSGIQKARSGHLLCSLLLRCHISVHTTRKRMYTYTTPHGCHDKHQWQPLFVSINYVTDKHIYGTIYIN